MLNVYVVGLQRTGTNYLQTLLERNFSCNIANNFFKHGYANELSDEGSKKTISAEVKETGFPCVVAVKNPVLWLESIVKRSPRDLDERRVSEIVLSDDKDLAYAGIYKRFYSSWISAQKNGICKIFRYEDILKGDCGDLAEYIGAKNNNIELVGDGSFVIDSLPMSVSFSDEDRKKYFQQKTSLGEDRGNRFIDFVGRDLVESLGYFAEEIVYSEASGWEKARDFVYQFTSNSSVLSDHDIAFNLAHLPSVLADDHALLISWAKWLQGRGEHVEALKKYILASEKISLMTEKFPDQGFFEIRRAECMRAIQEIAGQESKKSAKLGRAIMLKRASGKNMAVGLDFSLSLLSLHEDKIEEALEFAKKAVEKEPNYAWMRHHAGSLFYKMKMFVQAEAEFRQAVDLEPKKAEHLFALSESLVAQGKYQEARCFALRACSEKPEFSWYWQHAGYISTQLGLVEEAIRLYRAAVMAEPNKADFWYQLSEICRRTGRNEDALWAGLKAAYLDPTHDWYHHHVGYLFSQNKSWKSAASHFQKAADLSPTKAEHWFSLSTAQQSDGSLQEAKEAAQVAVRVQPNHPWYAHHLGSLLRECGQFGESVIAYSNAIQLEPENANHWFGISESLRLLPQSNKAISAARHAFEIDPQHGWYNKHYEALVKELQPSS